MSQSFECRDGAPKPSISKWIKNSHASDWLDYNHSVHMPTISKTYSQFFAPYKDWIAVMVLDRTGTSPATNLLYDKSLRGKSKLEEKRKQHASDRAGTQCHVRSNSFTRGEVPHHREQLYRRWESILTNIRAQASFLCSLPLFAVSSQYCSQHSQPGTLTAMRIQWAEVASYITTLGPWMMDDGWWWWMMDDGWWLIDDGWWMMDDGWWMMVDGWCS